MSYAKDYTISEMMGATVARQIRNDDIAFIGIGLPLIAGICANNTHAPDAILIYEGGGVGARSPRIPWTVADNPTAEMALAAGPQWRVLGDLQRGFVTLGILGGAEVDRFGNLNTTVIPGEVNGYARPKVRLPGSGGANDIASCAKRVVIMMRLVKGKFVNQVRFITSPGHLTGPGARAEAGLTGNGPEMVVTDQCIFKFDNETKEMYLAALFPGRTVERIKEQVEWELKVSPKLEEVEPPTEDQVKVMRTIDPMGVILGKGAKSESFQDYYTKMKQSYKEAKKILTF